MSLNHLANRYTCSWPWSIGVLLCDGRMVCGCADPYAKRVLGDTRTSAVAEIWRGAAASQLRIDMNAGGSDFCGDCPLKLPLPPGQEPPQRDLNAGALPGRLYIETTAACNISCFQACCAPETGITRTRQAGMLDWDLFTRVVDEAGPSLGRIDFFNYGEAFLHKRAVEMCDYIKTRFPHIYLYTSTNGLAFTDEKVRQLARSGIDEVTFSIDGASQDTYVRYRQRGNFDKAIANLRALVDERDKGGRELPFVNWRYILFNWNDQDEEMDRARQLAAEIGIDRLCWEITDHPEDSFSQRFKPGSDGNARIRNEIWDNSGLGNAIPGMTPRAEIDVHTALPGLPFLVRAASTLALTTKVRNLSGRAFRKQTSSGRRLVRLGAQLMGAGGELINRDHARAWLPEDLAPGAETSVHIEVPIPETPGRYALKFDLVSEGVDWFEACGSPTITRQLWVR
ncbi:MAG: radical SAM protein [Acidobacteria bacterium]|nr:radical SAM protein [Acidobacteriota bacterium]MSO60512.1 radical SAM protein [Acidobacteriota bacterium]